MEYFSPKEPPQIEQVDREWSLFDQIITKLQDDDYKATLKDTKYSLVMFYTTG